MAILDFPTNPTTGDIYNLDTRSWQWTGTAWKLLATNSINNTPVGNSTANTGAFTTLTVVGNITSSTGYILGNGALLTGVITSVANINSGSSNLRVTTSSGNIAANVGSAGNVLVIASDGLYTTGIVSANSQVVLNSYTGSPEGGQLVLAYTGVTGLTGQGNGTWNLDVNSSNAFRIFTQDESGSTAVPVTVANTGMTVSNVRITGNIDGAGMLNPFLLAGM
jgi:hypothetical protein